MIKSQYENMKKPTPLSTFWDEVPEKSARLSSNTITYMLPRSSINPKFHWLVRVSAWEWNGPSSSYQLKRPLEIKFTRDTNGLGLPPGPARKPKGTMTFKRQHAHSRSSMKTAAKKVCLCSACTLLHDLSVTFSASRPLTTISQPSSRLAIIFAH